MPKQLVAVAPRANGSDLDDNRAGLGEIWLMTFFE